MEHTHPNLLFESQIFYESWQVFIWVADFEQFFKFYHFCRKIDSDFFQNPVSFDVGLWNAVLFLSFLISTPKMPPHEEKREIVVDNHRRKIWSRVRPSLTLLQGISPAPISRIWNGSWTGLLREFLIYRYYLLNTVSYWGRCNRFWKITIFSLFCLVHLPPHPYVPCTKNLVFAFQIIRILDVKMQQVWHYLKEEKKWDTTEEEMRKSFSLVYLLNAGKYDFFGAASL